jgi:hypothetical protein
MSIPRCAAFVTLIGLLDAAAAEAQCVYTLSATTFTAPSISGTRTIAIGTGSLCSWTAVSAASWITISSGAGGTGLGWTTILIEPNPWSGPRIGTLLVAGQTVSVSQEAGSCTTSVSPTSVSVGPASTSRTLSVITGTLCSWSATSSAAWITVTNAGTGAGASPVTFSVAANPAASPRTGTLTVAGQPVTVTQTGVLSSTPPPVPANVRIVY